MAHENPLHVLTRANEEGHFFKKSQELLGKLRHRLKVEEGAEALAEHSDDVQDKAVLEELAAVGITPDTVRLMHLIPLFQVAWADGAIQAAEEDLLRREAARCGILAGTPVGEAFEGLLKTAPSKELCDAAMSYVKALMGSLPADQAEAAKKDLTKMAHTVARASGGLFGMFFTVEAEEKSALDEITGRLNDRAEAVLESL
ncbi:MAG: hypothetical protein ACE366_17870 [Bradymonadia bacterium]